MARMSIDDMFLRDPRVLRLASALACSKFETRGRLLSVYAIVYDRVDAGGDAVVEAIDIDIAAELDGFAERMIEFGLADRTRAGVYVRGAKERTKYLATREETGRQGGIKSGETRRKKSKVQTKVTFEKNEGPLNPSVPDLSPPDLAPDPIAPEPPARAHAIPPSAEPGCSTEYDPASPRQVELLARTLWTEVSEARVAIAVELGLKNVIALPERNGTPAEPRGFRDLRDRVREEGHQAPRVCELVRDGLMANARDRQSVEWLSEKAFTEGGWRWAREFVPNLSGETLRAGPRSAASVFDAVEQAARDLERGAS